jgi:metal-responsive CopG/Arc/MetJ family transcriptional regulator
VKRTKCITIDVSLLAEAEEAAARLGTTFSALVEEALRMYLKQEGLKAVAERLAAVEDLLRRCLQKETRRETPEAQSGGQASPLSDNLWINILRRRG